MNPEQCPPVGYHFGGYRLVENREKDDVPPVDADR